MRYPTDLVLEVIRTGYSNETPPDHEYYVEVCRGSQTGTQLTIVTDAPIDLKPLQRFKIIVH